MQSDYKTFTATVARYTEQLLALGRAVAEYPQLETIFESERLAKTVEMSDEMERLATREEDEGVDETTTASWWAETIRAWRAYTEIKI
jgi:hypothetical protein